LSRSVIGSASSPGGGSKQIADFVRRVVVSTIKAVSRRSAGSGFHPVTAMVEVRLQEVGICWGRRPGPPAIMRQ
jgi:hypothetical protein